VPYRNSLMTMALRDSLGGNCRTVMVATVHAEQEQARPHRGGGREAGRRAQGVGPPLQDRRRPCLAARQALNPRPPQPPSRVRGLPRKLDESISTCRFAQRVAMVTNELRVNEEVDPAAVIRRLKQQVREETWGRGEGRGGGVRQRGGRPSTIIRRLKEEVRVDDWGGGEGRGRAAGRVNEEVDPATMIRRLKQEVRAGTRRLALAPAS
jgi:hypothetical protein